MHALENKKNASVFRIVSSISTTASDNNTFRYGSLSKPSAAYLKRSSVSYIQPVNPVNEDDTNYLQKNSNLLFGSPVSYRSILFCHDKGQISTIRVNDIKLFFSKGGSTFAFANGSFHKINDSLNMLMAQPQLNPAIFYRINKECIIHSNVVNNTKRLPSGELAVNLSVPNFATIVISKVQSGAFQQWLDRTTNNAVYA